MAFRSRVKEYLPIVGLAEFNKLSAKLMFGADRYKNSIFFGIHRVVHSGECIKVAQFLSFVN